MKTQSGGIDRGYVNARGDTRPLDRPGSRQPTGMAIYNL